MGSDAIGVEVSGLHGTGRTISGRSAGGEAAAKGLKEGLHSAGGSIGHFVVSSAVTSFVSDQVLDPANKLPAPADRRWHQRLQRRLDGARQ